MDMVANLILWIKNTNFIDDLKNKFPDYKENKFLKFGKAKKQSLKIRLAVETMMFFNKIGIDKFVYRIISLL